MRKPGFIDRTHGLRGAAKTQKPESQFSLPCFLWPVDADRFPGMMRAPSPDGDFNELDHQYRRLQVCHAG
jgi:hypothetical protein